MYVRRYDQDAEIFKIVDNYSVEKKKKRMQKNMSLCNSFY